MAKWITNWTASGEAGKWGVCSAAFAAQVRRDHAVKSGRPKIVARQVTDDFQVSRYILIEPAPLAWSQTITQRNKALAAAKRFSVDHQREEINTDLTRSRGGAEAIQMQKPKPIRIPPGGAQLKLVAA